MIFTKENFVSGFIENRDGKSEKETIIAELKEKYNLTDFYTVKQIHGTDIAVNRGNCEADGIIITGKGKGAAVLTADCVPVILFDNKNDIAGIFHSGWKGTVKGIVQLGIEIMKKAGAENISAVIYPSIRQCCFEIGTELTEIFSIQEIPVKTMNGKYYADLNTKILNVLKQENINQIKNFTECTCCNSDLFSYRRNKTEKRHFSWVATI